MTKSHTSYERVQLTLQHKEPDRIPFDLGGAAVTGMNIRTLRLLRSGLGLSNNVELQSKIAQRGIVGDDLIERLHIDVKNVAPNPPAEAPLAEPCGRDDAYDYLTEEFGIKYRMPLEGGHYYDICAHPLKDARSVQDIETYPWPDPLDPVRFRDLRRQANRIVYEENKAYVLGRMCAGMWELGMWLTGYEKFFLDMVTNAKLVQAIMEKLLEIKMAYWEKALDTVGNNVLVASCADDLGTQRGLLVSLDLYKRLIWPYHKRLFAFIKRQAKSKVYIFFHNDGAIYETIGLLIEAGVDILNPWQVSCAGMDDTRRVKQEYGKDLTIWGGSCDTQRILPFGTPAQVREETKRRIEDLAPGGGFVFAPIHVIQDGVPPENIMAWWETLQEYGSYQ
jgi:uroporphyrinogen decarboxylase